MNIITTKMADTKRIYKCSLCQEAGHNKAKCPSAKKETEPQIETKPEVQVEQKYWIVMHGGTSKDWRLSNEVLALCATLEDAADAINERVKLYIEHEAHDEDDNRREIPVFTADGIKKMIDSDKYSNLIQITNIKADPEEEEDDKDGMWGNLRISIHATPRRIRNNHSA